MPAATVLATADSTARAPEVEDGAPRLRLTTEGPDGLWSTTQSSAAIRSLVLPDPSQSSTRTDTILADLATPYVFPAMVPATCVPWPKQSVAVRSLPTKSYPLTARPPNWEWLSRTPESMTKTVAPPPSVAYW